jgi:hypothetical protein
MSVLQKRKLHKPPLIALTYTNIHVTDDVTVTSLSASDRHKTSAAADRLCQIALNRNYRENSKSVVSFQVAIKRNRVKRDPRVYWRAGSHSVCVCVCSVRSAHTVGQSSVRWVLLWRTAWARSINLPHTAACFILLFTLVFLLQFLCLQLLIVIPPTFVCCPRHSALLHTLITVAPPPAYIRLAGPVFLIKSASFQPSMAIVLWILHHVVLCVLVRHGFIFTETACAVVCCCV